MFKFLLGLFLGANISLFLYAMIIAGKQADVHIEKYNKETEVDNE